ncbi:MAG: serine acetyltransferase [Clostridiales bacterium]|nr:serine acetyltransferase [Clostridiales bacterium]
MKDSIIREGPYGQMILADTEIGDIISELRHLTFAEFFGHISEDPETRIAAITAKMEKLIDNALVVGTSDNGRYDEKTARDLAKEFARQIPAIEDILKTDVKAAYDGDSAAKSYQEIIIAYPGLFAICVHRFANVLYKLGVPILPRVISEHAHSKTGIDIHPGATIGRSFFIDHGTGVVIGETTEIGDNVQVYQGVTLGALSPRQGQRLAGKKRHPTVESDVTIYANATVLGGDTVIGQGSVIPGNATIYKTLKGECKVEGCGSRDICKVR